MGSRSFALKKWRNDYFFLKFVVIMKYMLYFCRAIYKN